MIYTVTFNPAIDYVISLNNLTQNSINRAEDENYYFGGKGINVSFILKELGLTSTALGFVAGFTGAALKDGISSAGINTDFIELEKGFSRINLKINCDGETEINGIGPEVSAHELELMYEKLEQLQDGDTLILAGSIPSSLPENIYEIILSKLSNKNIITVVDSTKNLLLNTLKYKPFLIKPNHIELAELFDTEISDENELIFYAKKLQELGALNVIVSLAGDGAILLDETGVVHRIKAPEGEGVNSVCAGDSMLAGFIAGYSREKNYFEALKLGVAAGSATAFSLGLAKAETINEIYNSL